MRLIDADALRESLDKNMPQSILMQTYNREDIIRTILDAPTISNKTILILSHEHEAVKQEAYENGFHDGYKQAMRETDPCEDCQEWECDDCEFARR